jgi:hypothetical protein
VRNSYSRKGQRRRDGANGFDAEDARELGSGGVFLVLENIRAVETKGVDVD